MCQCSCRQLRRAFWLGGSRTGRGTIDEKPRETLCYLLIFLSLHGDGKSCGPPTDRHKSSLRIRPGFTHISLCKPKQYAPEEDGSLTFFAFQFDWETGYLFNVEIQNGRLLEYKKTLHGLLMSVVIGDCWEICLLLKTVFLRWPAAAEMCRLTSPLQNPAQTNVIFILWLTQPSSLSRIFWVYPIKQLRFLRSIFYCLTHMEVCKMITHNKSIFMKCLRAYSHKFGFKRLTEERILKRKQETCWWLFQFGYHIASEFQIECESFISQGTCRQ